MLRAANDLNSKSEWVQVGDHYENKSIDLDILKQSLNN